MWVEITGIQNWHEDDLFTFFHLHKVEVTKINFPEKFNLKTLIVISLHKVLLIWLLF